MRRAFARLVLAAALPVLIASCAVTGTPRIAHDAGSSQVTHPAQPGESGPGGSSTSPSAGPSATGESPTVAPPAGGATDAPTAADLVVAGSAFPGGNGTPIPQQELPRLLADLALTSSAGEIEPERCRPVVPSAADAAGMTEQGADVVYTSVVVRTGESLDTLAARLRGCPDLTVAGSETTIAVTAAERSVDGITGLDVAAVYHYAHQPDVAMTQVIVQRGDIRLYVTQRAQRDTPPAAGDPGFAALVDASVARAFP